MMSLRTLVGKAAAVARRLGLRRATAAVPGNLHSKDPAQVSKDAEYGFGCGQSFKYQIERFGIPVRGASILEVGPGTAFGAVAYLAAHGAKSAVADQWLSPWQTDYHGHYYRALADLIDKEGAGGDGAMLRKLADAGAYEAGPIALHSSGAEALSAQLDGAFDVICSNAVLEHLAEPARAFSRFFQLTRPGGLGVHQVDFRDHRDFSRPLEYLLMRPAAFDDLNRSVHYEYGSQRRQSDYASLLQRSGFEIAEYSSNDRATDAYLADLLPRLRAAKSAFAETSAEAMRDLGGLFIVRRPTA